MTLLSLPGFGITIISDFSLMRKVSKNRSFLERLCNNPKLISRANLTELACVIEILHNISHIPFTGKEKKILCKHLPVIKEIAKCTRERKARDNLVQYGGGFLAAVIPAALALLSLYRK